MPALLTARRTAGLAHGVEQISDLILVGDIGSDRHRLSSERFDLGDDLFGGVGAGGVVDRHRMPPAGELEADGAADPPRPSGDEGNPAAVVDFAHLSSGSSGRP